ncbi:MAG: zinc ABC transporter substrate-binding protein [Spirochaetaceae bacterium]|nr:zinc ABC transporter substrate-binding protein [Spirochaetaceae bacterium]
MNKIIPLLLISLMAASCQKEIEEKTINVVTTTSFITDVVSRIAGDSVEITELIQYGQDPHSYEPSPRDIAKVEKADLIFVNGFGLEEGLMDILENNNGTRIISLSDSVNPIKSHEGHGHEYDPHTWMSPLNVVLWAEKTAESLIVIDEKNSALYEKNRNDYIETLRSLHKWIESRLSVLKPEERIMITDHDSLSYFAREYDFTIIGTIIPGTSSISDTSPKSIIELINLIEETGVNTLFIGETSGSLMNQLAENISSELKRPLQVISLKSGSLDRKGNGADSYIKYMEYNTKQIINGLLIE